MSTATDDHALDEAQALRNLGGNRDLLLKMAEYFLTYSEELLAPMRAAKEDGDWRRLRDANHKLMGSVCNFGKNRAYHAAKMLEESLDAQAINAVDGRYRAVEEAVQALNEAFRGLLGGGVDLPH
jgi:HPt (histidine-containing phosphotransfer) domain-containing protein